MRGSQQVSVVMPSLNQAPFIDKAIESVLGQDKPVLELIVADGGSTDGTVDILKHYAAGDARLRWRSDPDTGPANAVNKALARTRGTLIGWLNADDLYAPGAVARAVAALEANPDWLVVYGHGQHIDEHDSVTGPYPTRRPDILLAAFAEGCFICQPTVFLRRTVFLLLGKLDESLRTAFDFDYWLRAFKAFPGRIGFIDALQASSRLHAACITSRQRRLAAKEGVQVLARHLGAAPKEWVLSYALESMQTAAADTVLDTVQADVRALQSELAGCLTAAEGLLLERELSCLFGAEADLGTA